MLSMVCWLLLVVAGCCLLCVGECLLLVVCRCLVALRCSPFLFCRLIVVVRGCWSFGVRCLFFSVCFLFVVCCLPFACLLGCGLRFVVCGALCVG